MFCILLTNAEKRRKKYGLFRILSSIIWSLTFFVYISNIGLNSINQIHFAFISYMFTMCIILQISLLLHVMQVNIIYF